jgi:hypothetical protein
LKPIAIAYAVMTCIIPLTSIFFSSRFRDPVGHNHADDSNRASFHRDSLADTPLSIVFHPASRMRAFGARSGGQSRCLFYRNRSLDFARTIRYERAACEFAFSEDLK